MRSIHLVALALSLGLAACGKGDGSGPSATGRAGAPWAQCATCHSLAPGKNGIGPSLAGVYGRPAAQEPSFAYSTQMRTSGIVWDDAALDAFLKNPRAMVPGTKMAFGGIEDPAERAAVIAFLRDR